ncbi:photoreceptor cilium actin regulator [Discoglossus pictus]
MGCSPSHSGIIHSLVKNATIPLKKQKAILPPSLDNNGFTVPLLGNNDCEISTGKLRHKESLQENGQGCKEGLDQDVSDTQSRWKKETSAAVDEDMVRLSYQKGNTERTHVRKQSSTASEQELGNETQQEANPRKGKKSKRFHKQGRRTKSREKEIVFCETETKVDFPDLLVKAHQDAYAYLNPNLSKYEAIVYMANQATQTQLIMQQMVSFMALRFDEINQHMEEIAKDGEKLLEEVGNNLTWPLGKGVPTEQPDLLQQLLQYTVNKMQTLNCTVASLTSTTLQDTCNYLQSASTTLQDKLKKKKLYDDRLLRIIRLLEALAAGPPQPHPNDSTLYSEDSGIGGDNESIREFSCSDKGVRLRSCDSVSLEGDKEVVSQQKTGRNKMTEFPKGNNCKETSDINTDKKESIYCESKTQFVYSNEPKRAIVADCLSMNSLESSTTLDQETEDTIGSDESSDEEEDNQSVSDEVSLPQRPMTSPAGTGAYKHSSKWLENPENEEMSLKMKEAISERIKFVPVQSNNHVWIRDEGATSTLMRPNTASGCRRRTSRHRRSRSAESLRSQAEDPTLLELQRTQKELSKKLEQLYVSNDNKSKETHINIRSFMHKKESIIPCTSTNKLKACLDKSFNILPSQERVNLRTFDQSIEKNSNDNKKPSTLGPGVKAKDVEADECVTSIERKLLSMNISPRQSVRKLIQTFSPVEDSMKIKEVKPLGPLRGIRKFGVPVLPPTLPAYRGLQPLNHKPVLSADEEHTGLGTFVSSFPSTLPSAIARNDTNEVVTEDFENLPPPPLEILMDDSFNMLQSNGQEKHEELNSTNPTWQATYSESSITKTISTSQRIKSSINAIDILPSRNATDTYKSGNKSFRNQDIFKPRKYSSEADQHLRVQKGSEMQRKQEIEQAAHLYRQSHKIIPLHNPGDVTKSGNDGEIKETSIGVSSLSKQKQGSPVSQRRSEKSPAVIRRISPSRVIAPTPPSEKKISDPPVNRAVIKTQAHGHSSSPPLQNVTIPTASPKVPSPPTQRKLPSTPSQPKQSSPPPVRRQQSPPSQRRLPSPPNTQREPSPQSHCTPTPPLSPSHSQRGCKLASPPQVRRQQSPQSQRRLQSPPSSRREPSPPSHCTPTPPLSPSHSQRGRKLASPPQVRSQQSPPSQRRLPSPPSSRREPSPPSHFIPSPPVSPSFSPRGLRRSSDEPQPSPKMFGNAQSIFCPSSTSLFEAKLPSPPNTSGTEVAYSQVAGPILRNNLPNRSYEDQHRRIAMSAANPQPFVRRCFSERRPRVQLRLPVSITAPATNDQALHQIG